MKAVGDIGSITLDVSTIEYSETRGWLVRHQNERHLNGTVDITETITLPESNPSGPENPVIEGGKTVSIRHPNGMCPVQVPVGLRLLGPVYRCPVVRCLKTMSTYKGMMDHGASKHRISFRRWVALPPN